MSKGPSGFAGEHYPEDKVFQKRDPAEKADKTAVPSGDAGDDKRKEKKDAAAGKEKENPKAKGKKGEEVAEEEPQKTESQILAEEAEYRAMLRRTRFKRHWPEITKVKIHTRPWHPPPPPARIPHPMVDLPELTTRRWVPPYRRRRRPRPRKLRVPPEEITKEMYDFTRLRKIWHNFMKVDKNKMMLQGSIACNSKRYSSTHCGSQTGCIAVACRVLLQEKAASELTRRDVDELIDAGDRYYHQCMLALKCYKGNPQLELKQLLTPLFFHEAKYTVKMVETDTGLLAKHPDNVQAGPDLMALMEKRVGSTYMMILTVGSKHFLIWGHPPPPEAGSQCKTVCYIFDPHMLDEKGTPHKLFGAGAFLRYAGVTSFVLDFLANYGDLDSAKKGAPKPPIALTDIEVVQREPLLREPKYELDLKALKIHCRSEWESIHHNVLVDKKRKEGEYPLCSLSAVSIATSKATPRKKVREFYQKTPKEPPPVLPMAPERAPAGPTTEQLMSLRGEDFFLYCPKSDGHTYGRDDMIPQPKSETILHSPVDVAARNFHSQFQQLDARRWILRGTRHMASYRYQTFKSYTAIPCCVAALAMLRRLRARAWNEDTLDETLDLGYNLYRESLLERGGPIRRLVLGVLKDNFRIRDCEYYHKEKGIAVWGKCISNNPKVFDLSRGIERFFKDSDAGLLQIPGEYETAIWNEGGMYYLYHPWPADQSGLRVGLRAGGKACLLQFSSVGRLVEQFLDSAGELRRKPFSISDVNVQQRAELPAPENQLKPVAPGRWVVRGGFHEADARFPEEHRGKQATPASIAAIAMAHVVQPSAWTRQEVDESVVRGDILYQSTIEHLERMGISLDAPKTEEEAGEEEDEKPSGTLAAVDVMNRFKVSEYDCIETEVLDSAYSGSLSPDSSPGVMSLKQSLRQLFKEHSHAVVTARGGSTAVWRDDKFLYFFDPHGCDENGYPSSEPRAAACLIRVKGSTDALAAAIESNLSPGPDDSFNISPVLVTATKLNPEIGAPETNLESTDFAWIRKGTAAIMMGPRGENSALGKAAEKAGIGDEDKAGRAVALPAAAAFCAATDLVPPPLMHQDHMFNFLDAGADYYNQLVKKTGNKDVVPEDLTERFEMGANTFSIELEAPTRLPLRLPDAPVGEGEEEGGDKEILGEGEEEPEKIKEIKDLLFKMWYDQTKPTTVSLLVGDYHQLGVWMSCGGKVVAFDPAPTLIRGLLTSHRIQKGDELRLQRIKDEMAGEGGGEPGDEEEEAGAEGEEQPEPEPEPVPREAAPVLMVFASPGEFVDRLTQQGGLDNKQCLAPYKLYPVKVTNDLTALLKEKRAPPRGGEGDEPAAGEEEEEVLVEALDDAAVGKYMTRLGRATASVRGRLAQNENFFLESARDNQDAAMSVVAIVVDHIEPHVFWKPALVDAILKYGDRLYSAALPAAASPPRVRAQECPRQFHLTSFNVKLEMEPDVVKGDVKAGDTGSVLSLRRGINSFFESQKYGVLCAKAYCVGLWRGADEKAYAMWDPHCCGPAGRASPGGAAGVFLFSTAEELADTFRDNVEGLNRPGNSLFSITSVKVFWEFSKQTSAVTPQGAVPDEGYEWKVLTAYVETARGRTILRGSRPPDITKFARDALLQSSCGAIVAACMSHVRRPHLWTRKTVDQVMSVGCQLFAASLGTLGYEFRPGEDVLLPLQVLKRFVLGVNYVRYDLEAVFSGKLEQSQPTEMSVRCALERFFEAHTHGILWSAPHAVAVWRAPGAPGYYMAEPHACGPTGLRADAQDDGAACVLTFTSAKLMAFAYLQNIPPIERPKHDFYLYAMSVVVAPIKRLGGVEPPLVRAPPSVKLVPATSKVGVDGSKRRASESDRKHPPGGPTCSDAQRASEARDAETKLKGQRNTSGWLVLQDGTQFLSACHSIACSRYPHASRGNQALACSVMAVAMSRVEDVCRWCSSTLDQILDSGDQLYQDSYLHYRPYGTSILTIEQILRKFYTPGNCVCRLVVYQARQAGCVDADLVPQLTEFFREERSGVFVAGRGDFAVALFRTPRGFYMFDPADRDRYGRAVPPPCVGRARACFSQYASVQSLAEKLCPNIPPVPKDADEDEKTSKGDKASKTSIDKDSKEVRFEEPAKFQIYGMDVTSLRRLNQHEK